MDDNKLVDFKDDVFECGFQAGTVYHPGRLVCQDNHPGKGQADQDNQHRQSLADGAIELPATTQKRYLRCSGLRHGAENWKQNGHPDRSPAW
ncbi:hypothetical protein GF1_09950 [Desulfolithobacter dissulfuricans]|uniref:Uncharacterized protein n=1 Tax=Desulfolithobacter dissulfuricans TaxID=2795293 RepID=A0A915U082_9BACT|nr:hypothetical protein GF1_09950 [Desulfolithobacter dissulfuricans]